MIDSLFIPMSMASVFLCMFLWRVLPHRYNRPVTFAIVAADWLFTTMLDYTIAGHIEEGIDLTGNALAAVQILSVLATAMIVGEHRDSRAIFVGLTASTYYLACIIVGTLVYYYVRDPVVALSGNFIFSLLTIEMFCAHNRVTPLTILLERKENRWRLCLIPLTSFVSIFAAAVSPGNVFTISLCRPLSVIMILVMFLYYFLVMGLLRAQWHGDWLNSNNDLLQAYTESLKKQMEQIEEAQAEFAVLRHDFRHRASLIAYYIETGNINAVMTMVTETTRRFEATTDRRFCSNSTLNWILQKYSDEAEKKGISFSVTVDVGDIPAGMEFDFGTIVLNLLENAFTGVEHLEDNSRRRVAICVRTVKKQIFIEVENPYDGVLHFSPDTGIPLSSKSPEHGYGLRSVIAFARKYDASYECDAGDNVFRVSLLMPVREDAPPDLLKGRH